MVREVLHRGKTARFSHPQALLQKKTHTGNWFSIIWQQIAGNWIQIIL